ncbi:MAG: universal stress protein [Spirosomataceae bacterium]
MKTILVPVDFSPASEAAVEVAAQIAKPIDATVVLLHLVKFPKLTYTVIESAYYTKDEFSRNMVKDARMRLNYLIDEPRFEGVNFKIKIEAASASLTDDIIRRRADLIVMGSTGASGWKELTQGSNAEHVVRNSKRPVLVVKAPIDKFVPQKVLFATDFNETAFIDKSVGLLAAGQWTPYFVYVDTGMYRFDSNLLREKMAALAHKLKLTDYDFTIYNAPTEEKGILGYAHEIEADLIVMHTHARKGLEHFLLGSVTEDVVNHADIPVMSA